MQLLGVIFNKKKDAKKIYKCYNWNVPINSFNKMHRPSSEIKFVIYMHDGIESLAHKCLMHFATSIEKSL